MTLPILTTQRLRLRPFSLSDTASLVQLVSHPAMIDATPTIPYPYHANMQKKWIKNQHKAYQQRKSLQLAVELTTQQRLIGGVSLMEISTFHQRAEIGYWIGVDYWQQGYGKEAVTALMSYAFQHLQLNRIQGQCLARNQASARVMLASGFNYEGERKQQIKLNGQFEDVHYFGLLRCNTQT